VLLKQANKMEALSQITSIVADLVKREKEVSEKEAVLNLRETAVNLRETEVAKKEVDCASREKNMLESARIYREHKDKLDKDTANFKVKKDNTAVLEAKIAYLDKKKIEAEEKRDAANTAADYMKEHFNDVVYRTACATVATSGNKFMKNMDYKCQEKDSGLHCDYVATRMEDLKTHVIKRRSISFRCHICSKSYGKKLAAQGCCLYEKSFNPCEICGQNFSTNNLRDNHFKSVHIKSKKR
jgi:hypothetical protein